MTLLIKEHPKNEDNLKDEDKSNQSQTSLLALILAQLSPSLFFSVFSWGSKCLAGGIRNFLDGGGEGVIPHIG